MFTQINSEVNTITHVNITVQLLVYYVEEISVTTLIMETPFSNSRHTTAVNIKDFLI